MKFMNALEEARSHIQTLRKIVFLLIVIIFLLSFGWLHAQRKIKIEIPPQIPESGLTLSQGEVPLASVYSFAYYVWQSINHWEADGTEDYKKQIEMFSPF